MHTAVNRFPLLGRPRPACPALPERAREVADIAHTATQASADGPVRAKNVLTLAALIASDCGMPDLARDLCWQHINTYRTADRQLGATEARHMLESVLNLARLQLRANHGNQAVELLAGMYHAVRAGTDLVVEQRTLPLANLTGTKNEHRTLREWVWLTYLSEGIRALTLAHRWTDAATHAKRLRGVGAHLLEGRQAVILAHHVNENPDAARAALTATTPQHPWEIQVAACLTVLCGNPDQNQATRDVNAMIQNFTDHPPVPGYAAYRAQLGLTVSTLAQPTNPDAARHVLNQAANEAIQAGDGYAARDLLRAHQEPPSLTTEQHPALTNIVTAAGLGSGTMPDPLLRSLARSAQIAVDILSTSTPQPVPEAS
jgi:hypothetical protein